MNAQERGRRARENFTGGMNCAQAVACAFADRMDMSVAAVAKLSSSFGGGMGRMREVCGSVSGALMVLGALTGYDDFSDPALKKEHYARVQDFAGRFRAQFGSIICRELLEGVPVNKPDSAEPEARSEAYYQRRPCAELVETSARLLAEMLEERV